MGKHRYATFSFFFSFLCTVFPIQNSITKILINQQVLILTYDWFLRIFWEYSRPESVHTEIKAKCDQSPQWQEVSGSILYCCPSFWQQWLLSTLVKLAMKWQWLPRALNLASKERKIGDVEAESGFAASDILSDLSLSLCMALRKSQLSEHPEKPSFWGNVFPFGEVLAVPSVIQKDALCFPELSICSHVAVSVIAAQL